MGEVIAVFRILPDSPENFNSVRSKIKKMKPAKLEDEPVAFGLKAVRATFLIPDEGGKMDEIENMLNCIEGVQSSETLQVSRSL